MTVVDPIDGKLDIGFVSQLEGIIDVNTLRISAPIFEAKIYPVRVNSRIEGYMFCKANQIFRIAGVVTDRLIIDDIALLDVFVTENPERMQRRQFYRFDCKVPVTFIVPDGEEPEVHYEIDGYTLDISGGGISAVTDRALAADLIVSGILKLDTYELEFQGKVIRCRKEIILDELKYISSIGFIDLEYKERENIVSFIFNQQRELLKRGQRYD
ncbi:MAG: putative glycosyltransferase [Eubacterium sp.]|nr:putative glycosyltransferase [Eubacterium sp.]